MPCPSAARHCTSARPRPTPTPFRSERPALARDAIPERDSGPSARRPSPARPATAPARVEPQRRRSPQRGQPLPQRPSSPNSDALPQRASGPNADALPQRGQPLPQRGQPLPQRGEQPGGPEALPRRTTRTRPSGRHRSPHRLSVASDAPALIIAVPGSAEADMAEIGPRVASIAGLSCPGVEIRVGYVDGSDLSLADCLLPPDAESGPSRTCSRA